jgi:hypothetical protein
MSTQTLRPLNLNVNRFLVVLGVSLIFPIVSGNISPLNILLISLLLLNSWLLGSYLLVDKFASIKEHILFDFVSVFIGFSLFSLLLPIAVFLYMPSWTTIGLVTLISFWLLTNRKLIKVFFSFEKWIHSVWLLFLVGIIFLGVGLDKEYLLSETSGNLDPTFFTSVVSSLNTSPFNHTINQYGSHLNYQFFSFLPPSMLVHWTGIASQVALWGVWMPFCVMLFGLLIGVLPVLWLNNDRIKSLGIAPIIAFTVFIGLSTLHIKNFVNLDLTNVFLPGIGTLSPGGNVPFTVGSNLALLLIHAVIHESNSKFKISNLVLLGILLGAITGYKVALLPAVVSFTVIYIFIRSKRILGPFILSISTIISAFVFYFVCNPAAGFSKVVFEPLTLFREISNIYNFEKGSILLGLGVLAIHVGVKSFIPLIKDIPSTLKSAYWSSVFTLIICLLFPMFLGIHYIDANGNFLKDTSFDMLQFARSGYFLLTVASVGPVVFLLSKPKKLGFLKALFLGHVALVFISWNKHTFFEKAEVDQAYIHFKRELKTELAFSSDFNVACLADSKFNFQGVSADYRSVQYFNTTNAQIPHSGYKFSNEDFWRNLLIDSMKTCLMNHDYMCFRSTLKVLSQNEVDALLIPPSFLNHTFIRDSSVFMNESGIYVKQLKKESQP